MLRIAYSIPILLVVLLVGCSTIVPGSTSMPQPPTPVLSTGPTAAAAPNGVLIIYHKSGGIAGIDETMTVYEDGTIELTSRGGAPRRAKASPEEIDRLRQVLGSDDFARLEPSYPSVGADLITYTLIVPAGSGQRTIVTMDGAQRPPALDRALELLEGLRAKFR